MAVELKVSFNLDTKQCTVEDLNPAGTEGTLTMLVDPTWSVTGILDMTVLNPSITFNLPLDINGDILEGDYELSYSQDTTPNPTTFTNTYLVTIPEMPTTELELESDLEAGEISSEDLTDYDLDGYTGSFTRTHTLVVPAGSGISDITQVDSNVSPDPTIVAIPVDIDGAYVATVVTDCEWENDYEDYFLVKGFTITESINVVSEYYGETTIEAMNALNESYLSALGTNYVLSETLKQTLFRVNIEYMLYRNYRSIGDIDNAILHSERIKTLLNSDE